MSTLQTTDSSGTTRGTIAIASRCLHKMEFYGDGNIMGIVNILLCMLRRVHTSFFGSVLPFLPGW